MGGHVSSRMQGVGRCHSAEVCVFFFRPNPSAPNFQGALRVRDIRPSFQCNPLPGSMILCLSAAVRRLMTMSRVKLHDGSVVPSHSYPLLFARMAPNFFCAAGYILSFPRSEAAMQR